MSQNRQRVSLQGYPHLRLPISLLIRYLYFLTRRPISRSNLHYLNQRLGGLKSLSVALQKDADIPGLTEAGRQLGALSPANFRHLARRLQYTLLPLAALIDQIPGDVVLSSSSPPRDLVRGARRSLLLLGPAIGIGDEIILFPLPVWLKGANPEATVSVCSAYPGLWERVRGVDRSLHYDDYLSLLAALRGAPPFDEFDLVILADFERPGLYPSICYEGRPDRYVELSLGTQSLSVVDNRRRWVHRAPRPSPYFANYYFGLDYLARWLGLAPEATDRFSTIVQRAGRPPDDHLRIYVNPFTSKHEPAEPYWSHLLSALFADPPGRQVQFALEPGPNTTTRRFAGALMRSAQARAPAGVRFVLAEQGRASTRSLQDSFGEMERAHLVVCADSFAAHAAPLFDCTTLVIATAGLENWRVPHRSSYYFESEAPLDQTVRGMQQVVRGWASRPTPGGAPLPLGGPVFDLEEATRRLEASFKRGDFESIQVAFHDFLRVYSEVIDHLPQWPPEFGGLLSDFAYQTAFCPAQTDDSIPDDLRPAFVQHLRDHWQQWQNTNLRKYLGLLRRGTHGGVSNERV